MEFRIIGRIHNIETIASGHGIKELHNLEKQFGKTNWRKLKGMAKVELLTGNVQLVELHWYEGHGIGRQKMKVKRFLD